MEYDVTVLKPLGEGRSGKPALLEIYKTTIIAAIQLFKMINIDFAGTNSSAWCELRVAHCQAKNVVLEPYFKS